LDLLLDIRVKLSKKVQNWDREVHQNIKEKKSRGSRITTYTYFTRLPKAFKLKLAPLFAPLTNLL